MSCHLSSPLPNLSLTLEFRKLSLRLFRNESCKFKYGILLKWLSCAIGETSKWCWILQVNRNGMSIYWNHSNSQFFYRFMICVLSYILICYVLYLNPWNSNWRTLIAPSIAHHNNLKLELKIILKKVLGLWFPIANADIVTKMLVILSK